MEGSKIISISIGIIVLLIGSYFFGTSFLIRACRSNSCQTDFDSCRNNCQQNIRAYSDSLLFNQSTISAMYQECNSECQNRSNQCIENYPETQKFERKHICKYLSYK